MLSILLTIALEVGYYLIGCGSTGKTDIAASVGIDICDTFEDILGGVS